MQNPPVAVIVDLNQGIDAAQSFEFFFSAIRGSDLDGEFLARLEIIGQS